ncbi:hypothetical protein ACFLT5_04145 [Chloroflexota bacterium]
MKVLLALQVIGRDLKPVQLGVSGDPDLIRRFVHHQRAELRGRIPRVPAELATHEGKLAQTKEAVLDTILDLIGGEPAKCRIDDEQYHEGEEGDNGGL